MSKCCYRDAPKVRGYTRRFARVSSLERMFGTDVLLQTMHAPAPSWGCESTSPRHLNRTQPVRPGSAIDPTFEHNVGARGSMGHYGFHELGLQR